MTLYSFCMHYVEKAEVKFTLVLIKHHAMKTYDGVEV
jgi:hypothetical protein